MGRIHVLDQHVAELIAAGEVVERPSSVIKELLENAVDAGATSVTVEIKHGGVSYLRVTDNGCGIAREDVPVAFLRHATSKVNSQKDLEGILTLGFRGEALASIAAVARVELLTRVGDALEGTRYVISGGEEESCEPAGCPAGTTIVVRDLFYNTPARMKFLKKDVVEGNAVASVIDKLALSHPEIAFRFLRDGKEGLRTPGNGKLRDAIYAVYGREFTQGLIPVDYAYGGVTVKGLISKPAAARPNRSMQNFFLNGRYVKSRTAMVALEEAYKGSLMVGKLPACVLHLTIASQAVDVNVHPAKIEVRFVNEKPLFDCVYHGVKTALNQGDAPRTVHLPAARLPVVPVETGSQLSIDAVSKETVPVPSVSQQEESLHGQASESEPEISVPQLSQPYLASRAFLRDSSRLFPSVRRAEAEKPEKQELPPTESVSSAPREQPAKTPEEQDPVKPGSPKEPGHGEKEEPAGDSQEPLALPEEKPRTVSRLIGEAFGTYIILERGDELVLIDKHAAHERMIYEKLKDQRGEADRQLLLQPIPVTLEKNEYAAVLEGRALCEQAGFEIEDFGPGTVLVRTVPLILGTDDIAGTVMEIAGYLLRSKQDLTTEKLDWLYHNVACRAAVKAGDESSPAELIALADRLAAHPEIRYCPHGRPVSVVFARRELEKQFGRIQ